MHSFIFLHFFQNYNGLTKFWLNSSEKRCLGGGSVSGKSGGGLVGLHPMKKREKKQVSSVIRKMSGEL